MTIQQTHIPEPLDANLDGSAPACDPPAFCIEIVGYGERR